MARNRKLYAALTRRGPHRALRGQLAFAGIPGIVYTPASGFGLPGLAFGHDWLTDADHYAGTCEHLASWGFVVAAPDTQRGLAPSVLNLAADLDATLDVITGVRLGQGDISVDPQKLGLAGHGFGGAAAVVAAADGTRAKAVAAVFPSVTKPSAEESAATLQVPGLVLATPDDQKSLRTDALEVAAAWDGAVLRVVEKASTAGVAERRRMLGLLGLQGLGFPGSSSRTQKTVRALLTGFLLFHLTGDDTYREFAEPDAVLPHTAVPDPEAPAVTHEDRIIALFR
ncbi:MAG: dienelactone hydrolase family protein [Mycobacterium sp.]